MAKTTTINSILYRFALETLGPVDETPAFLKKKGILRIDHPLEQDDKNGVISAIGALGLKNIADIRSKYNLKLQKLLMYLLKNPAVNIVACFRMNFQQN